jgi:hypothetical protein
MTEKGYNAIKLNGLDRLQLYRYRQQHHGRGWLDALSKV